jgi:hypothetical protein
MLLAKKVHLMQLLQQAFALALRYSVANRQIPVPQSCLPSFALPFNTSYHKRMKKLQ